jgi:hypothetical protein
MKMELKIISQNPNATAAGYPSITSLPPALPAYGDVMTEQSTCM